MVNLIKECDPQDLSCITIENTDLLLKQNEVIRLASSAFIKRSIEDNKQRLDELESNHPGEEPFKKIYNKTLNRHNLKNNIYIFSFNELLNLVKDTGATHIMVIDGAQQQEDASKKFKIGQSTIIIVPCVDANKSDPQGEKFKSVGNLAREHPQVRYERRVPFDKVTNSLEVEKV